jgi:imidazole glycerol-phosphate synthase subunit HisH
MNVLVIDLECGNIRSLSSALTFLGAAHRIVADSTDFASASHVILPGVGAFDTAMQAIAARGLYEPLREHALARRRPLLGVCLGMQLLFEGSEEGACAGLGIMPGRCVELSGESDARHKVPHVGFAPVYGYEPTGLFNGLGDRAHFYFTHSYAVPSMTAVSNVAKCDHARPFVAAFEQGNVRGAQFHPEKSQSSGLRLISNFLADAAHS